MNQDRSSDQQQQVSSSRTTNKLYTRGPYRSATKRTECSKDCEAIHNYLVISRSQIKEKFKLSHNRTKVLENMQGLIDYLSKQIKKQVVKEDPISRIQQLELRIKQLEKRVEEQDINLLIQELSE